MQVLGKAAVAVALYLMRNRVHSGQKRCPAGGTDWTLHIGAFKQHSGSGKVINVRRLCAGRPEAGKRIPTLLVGTYP